MTNRYICSHLAIATDIPIATLLNSKEKLVCADCDSAGPNLWICLHHHCLKVGCSSNANDHSTLHYKDEPSHCIYMNTYSQRIWCNKCQSEIFMDPHVPTGNAYQDSDQELEDCPVDSRDSGHGSYSTLQTNTPERVLQSERNLYTNSRIWGDTSESSDNEADVPYEGKPTGLVGLQNIGNTCYMNAALQALSNTIPLTAFFLECGPTVHLLSEDRKPGLSRQYQALMRDMWMKKNGGYVTPTGILYGIRNVHAMFRGYHQHDTQEFLRNFMDQLHEELKQVCPPECAINDVDSASVSEETTMATASYDSSEGEYETCDSGVSERSSLSDDTERPSSAAKRRLSRSASPGRRLRARIHSVSVIDCQPSTSTPPSNPTAPSSKKQTKYRSIISDIFDGKLLSSVQCLTCNRISSRVETFQDLSLPIPSRDHLMVLHGRNTVPGVTCAEAVLPSQDGWISWILAWLRSWFYGPVVTLHDCLAAFFSTDELKGDNMYSCERCNKLRNGLKYSKVLQLPEVLCIHLKRFRHELMFSSKISAAVSFPLKGLDMSPYLHKDCVSQVTNYELFSVICHHGTAGGGHYTCYALNNNQWYEYDDQCVTRVHPDVVQNCEAYVLFYRKVNCVSLKKLGELEDCEEDAYVSKQWLSRFKTCTEPGPIDNSDFLCSHNNVCPKRFPAIEQLTAVIPKNVYEYLYKKYGGCPVVTSLTVCPTCLALQKRITSELEQLQQLNTEFENETEPPTHQLSTAWYTTWKNFVDKRTPEPPGPIDNTKKTDNPDEFIDINKDIWNFFYSIYGGGPEVLLQKEEEESAFCKGEPMESEEVEAGDDLKDHSSTSNASLTDEVAEEPQLKAQSGESRSNKHRRRRRRDVN